MDAHQPIPVALALDGLANDARTGFALAADAGYRGVAFATNHHELNPQALGPSARRHVQTLLRAKGLTIDSLRAAAPREGLAAAGTIDRTLDCARHAITLARELGIHTVSLHIGPLAPVVPTPPSASAHVVPTPPSAFGNAPPSPAYPRPPDVSHDTIVSALRQLAQQADVSGITLAVSSDGASDTLVSVLKQVDFDRAKVNLETARLLGTDENVLQAAAFLAGAIGQLTTADAIRAGRAVRPALLGEGQLPLPELLALLREQGFAGSWVVDVRDLPDAPAAARRAAQLLRRLLCA